MNNNIKSHTGMAINPDNSSLLFLNFVHQSSVVKTDANYYLFALEEQHDYYGVQFHSDLVAVSNKKFMWRSNLSPVSLKDL